MTPERVPLVLRLLAAPEHTLARPCAEQDRPEADALFFAGHLTFVYGPGSTTTMRLTSTGVALAQRAADERVRAATAGPASWEDEI